MADGERKGSDKGERDLGDVSQMLLKPAELYEFHYETLNRSELSALLPPREMPTLMPDLQASGQKGFQS